MVETSKFGSDPDQKFVYIDLGQEQQKATEHSWIDAHQMTEIGFSQKQLSPIYTSRVLNQVMEASGGEDYRKIVEAREQHLKMASNGDEAQDGADIEFMRKQLADENSIMRRLLRPIDPDYRRVAENNFFWLDSSTEAGEQFINFAAILQLYMWRLAMDENQHSREAYTQNVISMGVNVPSLVNGDYTGHNQTLWSTSIPEIQGRILEKIFTEEDLLNAPHANQVSWLHLLDEVVKDPTKSEVVYENYSKGEYDDFIVNAINITLVAGHPVSGLVTQTWMKVFLEKWFEKHKNTSIVTDRDSRFWQEIRAMFGSDLKTPAWLKKYKRKPVKKRFPQNRIRDTRVAVADTIDPQENANDAPPPRPIIEDNSVILIKTTELELDADELWVNLADGNHKFTIPEAPEGFQVFVRVGVRRNGMTDFAEGFDWTLFKPDEICDLSTIYGGKIMVQMIVASANPTPDMDRTHLVTLEAYIHYRPAPEKKKPAKNTNQPPPVPDTGPALPTQIEIQPPTQATVPLAEAPEIIDLNETLASLQVTARRYKTGDFLMPNNRNYWWEKALVEQAPILPNIESLTPNFLAQKPYGLKILQLECEAFSVKISFLNSRKTSTKPTRTIIERRKEPLIEIEGLTDVFTEIEVKNILWGWLYETAFIAKPSLKSDLETAISEKEATDKKREEDKKLNFSKSKKGKAKLKSVRERMDAGETVRVRRKIDGAWERFFITNEKILDTDEIILQSPSVNTGNVAASHETVHSAILEPYYHHTIYQRIRRTIKAENDENRKPFEGDYANLAQQAISALKLDTELIQIDDSQTMAELKYNFEGDLVEKLVPLFIDLVREKGLGLTFQKPFTFSRRQILSQT